jgi:hypothetical protein
MWVVGMKIIIDIFGAGSLIFFFSRSIFGPFCTHRKDFKQAKSFSK